MKSVIEVNDQRIIGHISPHIYGQYVEHVQTDDQCIYPALIEADASRAAENGLRRDVMEAARELSVPVVRWPGGCFADFYHWQDGVGPRSQRPVRKNWHFGGLESNQFGTDEFLRWCQEVGCEAYINVNLGTGSLDEALRWLDYCNGTQASSDVRLREKNGQKTPYNVRYWGIGNETWGIWEAGHTDADTYGRTLANWARFFRQHDPHVQLMGVGSFAGSDAQWDRTVLDHAGHFLDYLTIHNYAWSLDRSTGQEYYPVVFAADAITQNIARMVDVVDEYRHQANREQPIRISMDEWNIRHYEWDEQGRRTLNRKSPRNMQDTIYAAGVLNGMIRLSPAVSMANYVFLVNGNGVLLVEDDRIVKTPLYYLFQQYGKWMQGNVLETSVRGSYVEETMHVQPQVDGMSDSPLNSVSAHATYVDATCAQPDANTLVLAVVNRHKEAEIHTDIRVPHDFVCQEAWTLHSDDVYAGNDFHSPFHVKPMSMKVMKKITSWKCPAHSVTLLYFQR